MKKVILALFASLLALSLLVSCQDKKTPDPVTYALSLDAASYTMETGDAVTATALATASDGTTPLVTWESADGTIATVVDGRITGLAVGTTTITATLVSSHETSASATVVVTARTYLVTYVNGDVTWTARVAEGKAPELSVLSEDGYVFDGWTYDAEGRLKAREDDAIEEDTTLYANWTEIITWTITYVTKGSCDGPVTYTNLDKTILLATPVYRAHEFIGWWTNPEFSGMAVTSISARSEGDLTFYAKWLAPDLSTMTFSIMGDSISTFQGEIPDGYTFFYPLYSKNFTTGAITTSDKMWFHLLEKKTGMTILMNDSYSGTTVSAQWQNAGETTERLNKLLKAGKAPNVIIIWMGTNDLVSGLAAPSFKDAYLRMIKKMRAKCPSAYIFCANMQYERYGNQSLLTPYSDAIKEIAETYDLGLIDLASVITVDNCASYLGDSIHLNSFGEELVAEAMKKTILEYFDLMEGA